MKEHESKKLELINFSLSTKLLYEFDKFVKVKGYSSRSEAIREAMRDLMHPRFMETPRE